MIRGHHHHIDPGAAALPHRIGEIRPDRIDEPDQTEEGEGRKPGVPGRYRFFRATMGHGEHPVAPGGTSQVRRGSSSASS